MHHRQEPQRPKKNQIVRIAPWDMTLIKAKYGVLARWMLTMYRLGVGAAQQTRIIVRCCVKPTIEQKVIDRNLLAARQFSTGTKFGGGGKARAGKNSFPPTPFLFARPSVKVFQNSASGFSRKKVRISFSVRSQAERLAQNAILLKGFIQS